MRKVAFKMKLNPGKKDEYIHRHNAIWPELKDLLHKVGIHDYTIFLDEETNTLFAVQCQEGEFSSQEIGKTEIVKRWWAFMADIMETNADNSPISVALEPVFHMD